MKKLFLYLLFSTIATAVFCQSTNISTFFLNNKKKADYYYSQKAYRNALEIYLHISDRGIEHAYAKQQVADCYLKLNDPLSAERWYKSLMKEPDVPPGVKYKYAQTLCMNKKYPEALEVLMRIDKKSVDSLLITKQIDYIKHIEYYLRDSTLFIIGNSEAINSPFSDYGATYFGNNVVFASTRDNDVFVKYRSLSSENDVETLSNLFFAPQDVSGTFGLVDLFIQHDLKTPYHDGPITFYDRGHKAAFTRSNYMDHNSVRGANGIVNLKLFMAELGAGSKLVNIKPFPFNSDEFSVGHATFSSDGKKMFFTSTNPEGFGGADIYYSVNKGGEWSEPVNAGPVVNTAGDELFPFIKNDSSLYFASNGQGGFGGLDIYLSNYRKGKFIKPYNLGHPMNSSYDDFSFVADSTGRVGFFTSNRPGGKGQDDVYFFISMYTFIEGEVREQNNPSVVVPGTYIEIRDEQGVLVDSMTSAADGSYHLDIPYDKNFTLWARREGYDMLENIGLSTKGLPFGIDSLMLPMWKHALYARGRIFSNETQSLLPGASVILKDLTTNALDTLLVDNTGVYTFVVLPNHKYRIEATKEGFIPTGFDLNTQDLFKGELLNDIVLEEVYIDKIVTLFDYNKNAIVQQWEKNLKSLLRTLRKYPKSILNISAHADARGTKQYNQQLSDKRAQAVVEYFINQGISRDRIDARGFGEELILNTCSDGVVCNEEDHSKNRRAEVKVQINQVE